MVVLTACALFLESFGVILTIPILEGIDSHSPIIQYYKSFFEFINISFTLQNCLLTAVVLIWFRGFFFITKDVLISHMMKNMLIDWRQQLITKSFEIPYQKFISKSSGFFTNVLVNESSMVIMGFEVFSTFLVTVLMVLVYLIIPFLISPSLFLWLLCLMLPLFFVLRYLVRKTKILSTNMTKSNESLQRVLIESISNYKYLKATRLYGRMSEQIFKHSVSAAKKMFNIQVIQSVSTRNINVPMAATIVAFIVYRNVIVNNESITSQFILAGMLYKSFISVGELQSLFQKLMRRWGGIKLIEHFEKDLNENWEPEDDKEIFDTPENNDIEIDSVSFAYDNSKPLLDNININIKENTSVAIVGESGAGKSTLANMLTGLLSPSSGRCTIGGIDYGRINREKSVFKIGYITQESVIFNDTVLNNITFWDEPMTQEKIKRAENAAKKAHIHSFISEQPEGYHSLLGEGGINVSGGQRQRISIARELYMEPDILIFDEATSALDSATEIEIQKNIDELRGQNTIVIIAHRLSTIRNLDKIFVLDKGRIVEEGSYDELLQKGGVFKKMVDTQLGA